MFVFTGNSGDRKCGWINWWIYIERRVAELKPPGTGPMMTFGNLNDDILF
jgi:hypothetical protein